MKNTATHKQKLRLNNYGNKLHVKSKETKGLWKKL